MWAANAVLEGVEHDDADFRVEALQEDLEKYGKPEIFNTARSPSLSAGNGLTCSGPPESRSVWTARGTLDRQRVHRARPA